jgi:DNA-binding Xre family transcriptional regulator
MKGGLPVDYRAIKTEYITGNISLRDLAEKHGISYSTLSKMAWKEEWNEIRNQKGKELESRTLEKTIEKESTKLSNNNDDFYRIVNKLFRRAEEYIENNPTWTPNSLKEMATTMRYLKECKGIKSDVDLKEQEARIKKLEAETNGENRDSTITVEIKGNAEDWGN